MKTLIVLLFLTVANAWACPDIAGKWSCYEKTMDYKYQENFQVTKQGASLDYLQILTDQNGEQPTYDKITDNVVRLVSQTDAGDGIYNFYQNSFCPDPQTLQTHELDDLQSKGKSIGKSSADYIVRLEADGSLSMITNSVDEDGTVYDNDFVGTCTRL